MFIDWRNNEELNNIVMGSGVSYWTQRIGDDILYLTNGYGNAVIYLGDEHSDRMFWNYSNSNELLRKYGLKPGDKFKSFLRKNKIKRLLEE